MEAVQTMAAADLAALRSQFPLLGREFNGRPVVYLDNAASAQKPAVVLERLDRFYREEYANIHRGVHFLSQTATEAYEGARARVAAFLGTASAEEIVFTKGATEAINLVAAGLGETLLREGDTVLLTRMEHHANIVPWQLLEKRKGIRIAVAEVTPEGEINREDFRRKLRELQPKMVGLVHVSNSLGTINPARELIAEAQELGARVLLDASQSAPHFAISVRDLGCDYLVFSGHKIFGPTGIGCLWGKAELLAELPPYQGGGDMIENVAFEGTEFKDPPARFEAGTPPVAQAVGLAAAIDFLEAQDREALEAHETALLAKATEGLREIPGLRIIGEAREKASVISFVLDCAHPHDIATFLDADGIAIRTGHHCTQPLFRHFGLAGSARASFAFYNTFAEVEQLVAAVGKVHRFFG
ncbi:MAG: SufS family cysteine desulfurase [Verrucomicrobia bacterium]|jgi:cysteine desulfurase/selenocysteine lyase|nr:SufS family cysteine desulfurase [Verrucomicrobiota bacterium]